MSKKMRFHSLSVPHNICNPDYTGCAYQMKALKFAKMMTALGHEVITYGVEGMQTESTEEVVVVDTQTFERVYGDHDYRSKFFKYDLQDEVYQTYYRNTIAEIEKRRQPNDFVLCWWGWGHKAVADAFPDLIVVESGIGYQAQFARWRIYESHAIRNASAGPDAISNCTQDYYHRVIPNYFDLQDFEYSQDKDDYVLYLGRVYSGKGVDIAIEATEAAGKRLIIAGQGSLKEMGYTKTPEHVTELGYADLKTRKQLMKRASALIIGSKYLEPFGGVQIEAMLSGTPVISPAYGAFAEYNIDRHTGFLCWTFRDYVNALKNIKQIRPIDCRIHGEKFGLDPIARQYERYFQDVLDVYTGKGWYQL